METEPPPDLRRLVHSTANRVLEESLRNLRQHNEVRRLIARGELTDLELNTAYHDYERQAGALYRQAVADLTVRYHAGLAELGVEYSRRFYEEILAKYSTSTGGVQNGAGPNWSFNASAGTRDVSPPAPTSTSEGSRPKRVALELHAPLGSVASGAFTLENRRDEPAQVSFDVSSWTASDASVVDVPIVLSPPELRIGPRSSADVTVAVRLVPDVFALDQLYTTSVAVKGYDGLELLLTVWAEPVPEPEAVAVDTIEQAPSQVTEPVSPAVPVHVPTAVDHSRARRAPNGSRRATGGDRTSKANASAGPAQNGGSASGSKRRRKIAEPKETGSEGPGPKRTGSKRFGNRASAGG